MHITTRRIGNFRGVVIPEPFLAQLGIERDVEMTIEGNALVLRKPGRQVRAGWAAAARRLAEHDPDRLVLGGFSNDGDGEQDW